MAMQKHLFQNFIYVIDGFVFNCIKKVIIYSKSMSESTSVILKPNMESTSQLDSRPSGV